MNLLYPPHCVRGYSKSDICMSKQISAAPPGEGDDRAAALARGLRGVEDVPGIAAGADRHQYIFGARQGVDLSGKDLFESEIVGHCRESGRVAGKDDRRKSLARLTISAYEFSHKMLRVGGAASVAAGQDLVPAGKASTGDPNAVR